MGVYWSNSVEYSKETMLFFAASMGKSIQGKFSYGKKLRSSKSYNLKMMLSINKGNPDFDFMDAFISVIKKLVIKDVVLYSDKKIAAVKKAGQ